MCKEQQEKKEPLLEQLRHGSIERSAFDLVKGNIPKPDDFSNDGSRDLDFPGVVKETVYIRCKKTGTLFEAIDIYQMGDRCYPSFLISWDEEGRQKEKVESPTRSSTNWGCLCAQRNEALSSLDQLRSAFNHLKLTSDAVAFERDRLRATLQKIREDNNAIKADFPEMKKDIIQLMKERDAFRDERNAAWAERDLAERRYEFEHIDRNLAEDRCKEQEKEIAHWKEIAEQATGEADEGLIGAFLQALKEKDEALACADAADGAYVDAVNASIRDMNELEDEIEKLKCENEHAIRLADRYRASAEDTYDAHRKERDDLEQEIAKLREANEAWENVAELQVGAEQKIKELKQRTKEAKSEADRRTHELELTYKVQKRLHNNIERYKKQIKEDEIKLKEIKRLSSISSCAFCREINEIAGGTYGAMMLRKQQKEKGEQHLFEEMAKSAERLSDKEVEEEYCQEGESLKEAGDRIRKIFASSYSEATKILDKIAPPTTKIEEAEFLTRKELLRFLPDEEQHECSDCHGPDCEGCSVLVEGKARPEEERGWTYLKKEPPKEE